MAAGKADRSKLNRIAMHLSPQSEKEANEGNSAPAETAVREQLKRLLAHPLFTNSKRYPVLLAYTVEQTLAGNACDLKERTIGVEAFGRQPSYDVNLDPVVRTTAAEVPLVTPPSRHLIQITAKSSGSPRKRMADVLPLPVAPRGRMRGVPSFAANTACAPTSAANASQSVIAPPWPPLL